MIAVDTSVWIDLLNDAPTEHTMLLREIISAEREIIVVGDLVLTEILQGLATEREAVRVASALRRFEVMPMVGEDIAVKSAANDRVLRGRGVTIRKTIDLLIGTFCIEHGFPLLHSDRDFDPMERHLGLMAVRS